MEFAQRTESGKEEHYSKLVNETEAGPCVKEIPSWWWEKHWVKVAKGKAAGPSKCSADMIAGAPKFIRELIRQAANIQLITGVNYRSQQRNFLHPVAKATPGDYRPLRLVETVAKAQRKYMIQEIYNV